MRRLAKPALAFVVLSSTLAIGCVPSVSIVSHDERKAMKTGRTLLETLYLRGDIRQALTQVDSEARAGISEDSLRMLVSAVVREFGPATAIKYVEFRPTLGARSASVVFLVTHQSENSYQRIQLRGDARGYLATAVSYSKSP